MASRSRAARTSQPRISYREASFEDDAHDDSFEESSNEEEEVLIYSKPEPQVRQRRPPKATRIPQTRSRTRISYKEDTTDEEEGEGNDYRTSQSRDETFSSTIQRPKISRVVKKTVASNRRSSNRPTGSRRLGAPRKAQQEKDATPRSVVVSDGRIPNWAALPYEILRVIFFYASYPLISDIGTNTSTVAWLLGSARICRAFHEPALHALYHSPPIDTPLKGHRLAALLAQQSEDQFNYQTKVRRLELEVNVLAHTAPSSGHFDVSTIMAHLPRLHEINIWDRDDDPASRIHQASSRWFYREQLFRSLNDANCRLSAWHWNHKFMPVPISVPYPLSQLDMLVRWHTLETFSRLKRLRLSNFGDGWFHLRENERFPRRADFEFFKEHEDVLGPNSNALGFDPQQPGAVFARSLNTLTDLSELDMRNSLVHTVWMQLLKVPLTILRIINCDQLESVGLSSYLEAHGSRMRELVLHHNSSLNLGFLASLRRSCPRLQVLRMDLTYRSALVASDAREPDYITLMEDDEEPTWPTTMRHLELLRLRNWTSSAAEVFFGSLVKSAESLTDLRRLVLSASISIGWRDRAAFRDTWIAKLERVFLRPKVQPSAHLQSLKAYRLHQEGMAISVVIPTTRKKRAVQSESDPETEETGLRSREVRRSKRSRGEPEPKQSAGSLSKSLKSLVFQALEEHVQGLCDVVDIRIDNLRPRENQLHESDFLDEEASGDEDYREGAEEEEETGRYAW